MKMEMFIKAIDKTIKDMAKVNLLFSVELHTKEIGSRISCMGKVNIHVKMAIFMRENCRMASYMERVK